MTRARAITRAAVRPAILAAARAAVRPAILASALAACGPGLSRSGARAPGAGAAGPGSDPAPGAAAAPAPPPLRSSDPAVYVDADGLFLVRFGVQPKVETKREPLGAGEIVTTTATLSTDARLLMAMKLEMTEVARYDCQRGIDGMRDHTLSNMGCAKVEEKRLEVRGRPAREVLFSCTRRPMKGLLQLVCDDAGVTTTHTVHAYELVAAYAERAFDEPDARAFLQSFDLR